MLDLVHCGAVDPNGIFPILFTKTADSVAFKISVVLCMFARISSFASCWRYNNVIPMSKSGSPFSIPSECHPISITPLLSKVFEYHLAKCLNAYVETNYLYPSLQLGFRKGLGTCDALLTITSAVQKSLDTGCEVCMIRRKFSATCLHVTHEALIVKLR